MGTPYRIFDDWAGYETQAEGNYTLDPNLTGAAPYLDTNDDAASFAEWRRESLAASTKRLIIKPPQGINIACLGWLGAYDSSGWPGDGEGRIDAQSSTAYRFEFIVRRRYRGTEPPFFGSAQMAFSDKVGGTWTGIGPFNMSYGSQEWSGGNWHTVYTGRSELVSNVTGRWQDASDAGTFGFKISIGLSETTHVHDVTYVALIAPICGRTARLRQRQRDDLRTRQRESRQLTARGRSYW